MIIIKDSLALLSYYLADDGVSWEKLSLVVFSTRPPDFDGFVIADCEQVFSGGLEGHPFDRSLVGHHAEFFFARGQIPNDHL